MKRFICLFSMLFVLLFGLSFDSKLSYDDAFAAKYARWHYVTDTNKNTGSLTKIGQVVSLNEVVLAQTGGVRARAMLVVSNKGMSVAASRAGILLTRGNYGECRGYEEGACFVYVTFDDEPSITMSVWVPDNIPNNALLLRQADFFITKLKTAKRLKVVLKFRDNLAKELTFDVSGFNWLLYEELGV